MGSRKYRDQDCLCETWVLFSPGMEQGWFYKEESRNPVTCLQLASASKLCPCPLLVPPFCKTSPFILLLASPPTPITFYSTTEMSLSCQVACSAFSSQVLAGHLAGCVASTDLLILKCHLVRYLKARGHDPIPSWEFFPLSFWAT